MRVRAITTLSHRTQSFRCIPCSILLQSRQRLSGSTSVTQQQVVSFRYMSVSTRQPSHGPSAQGPSQVRRPTSLAWQRLYDHAPASYGVQAFNGYTEFIPPKTPLPFIKTERMESALDYIRGVSFGICCRRNMLDIPLEIAQDAELHDVRLAKAGVTKFKVTMEMGRDLMGTLTVQDVWTRSKAMVNFDGGKALQFQDSGRDVIVHKPS